MAGKYSPIDPVCLGVNRPAPNTPESVVGSVVVGNNADLMRNVADLWIRPDDVVADVTYGRGVFWRNMPGMPTYRFDANLGDDCRDLPLGDESVDVVVFDPPYRPTHGSTGMEKTGVGKAYRVGTESLNTINDVLDLYRDGLIEAERILRPGGRVVVKCQDMSYGHRLHMVSMDVSRLMERAGLPIADHFVLANSGQISSTKWQKQERARRRHSVLWVGVKGESKIADQGPFRGGIVTSMEHAIEQVAKRLHSSYCECEGWYAECQGPQVGDRRVARRLAAEGLIAPAPASTPTRGH